MANRDKLTQAGAVEDIDLERAYCFSCGELHYMEHSEVTIECGHCGTRGVLHVQTAYDLLNDLYLRGKWKPHVPDDGENGLEEIQF